jgi:hypothetical protein
MKQQKEKHMEEIEIIISFAATILGLIVTAITFITKFVKNKKAKIVLENIIKTSEAILPFIEQAEAMKNISSEEKKLYVIDMLDQFAFENDIAFDEEKASIQIESLIDFSKKVNAKQTKRKKAAAVDKPMSYAEALAK